jgi:hypothetical protein
MHDTRSVHKEINYCQTSLCSYYDTKLFLFTQSSVPLACFHHRYPPCPRLQEKKQSLDRQFANSIEHRVLALSVRALNTKPRGPRSLATFLERVASYRNSPRRDRYFPRHSPLQDLVHQCITSSVQGTRFESCLLNICVVGKDNGSNGLARAVRKGQTTPESLSRICGDLDSN